MAVGDVGLDADVVGGFIRDELAPEPVGPPYMDHLLDGDVLGFGEEEVDEDGHKEDPTGEEVEEPELEVAQHRQEHLAYEECEEHVDRHVDGLPRRTDLQWEDLRRHQPAQRAPRPGKP